jgi:hypothetical protein
LEFGKPKTLLPEFFFLKWLRNGEAAGIRSQEEWIGGSPF